MIPRFKAVRHKYHAIPTVCDGIRFDSRKEAEYYKQLIVRKAAGEVIQFLRQVPFHLPGGVRYVCDFMVFLADGSVEFIDTKGFKTPEFLAKKKIVENLYAPITITIV